VGRVAELSTLGGMTRTEMKYTPNHISFGERVFHILLSLGLIGYGLLGFLENDLYLPGKRRGIHLHGTPALMMFIAMLCAAAAFLSVVIDHYDKRDNERYHRFFARLGEVAGWTFFGLALALDFFQPLTK
jgi:hypothetical protein